MPADPADQLERLVALLNANPLACVLVVVALLLILGFQKDGLFSRIFSYLEARATHEAGLEHRRMDIISMIENRAQRRLPGIVSEEGEP